MGSKVVRLNGPHHFTLPYIIGNNKFEKVMLDLETNTIVEIGYCPNAYLIGVLEDVLV